MNGLGELLATGQLPEVEVKVTFERKSIIEIGVMLASVAVIAIAGIILNKIL